MIVYGKNKKMEREDLWHKLREIKRTYGDMNEPWIIMGDFNEIRMANERKVKGTYDEDGVDHFNNMIKDTKLNELPTTRGFYTWSNKSVGVGLVRSKIDRVLVSEE